MKKTCLLLFIMFCLTLSADLDDVQNKIFIGGDSEYPPYEYINQAGQPDGMNVELSKMIARELGLQPVFRLSKWSLARSWLEEGKLDIIQGMAFSVERAQDYHFSSPYTSTWRSIFVRKDSDITQQSDIANRSVAIQQDDVAEEYLQALGHRGEVARLPSGEIALKLLDGGDFDAVLTNYMTGMYIIQVHNLLNIKALNQRIQQRDYCFASLDADLIMRINGALTKLEDSGELDKLRRKWLSDDLTQYYVGKGFWPGFLIPAIFALLLIILIFILYHRQKLKIKAITSQLNITQNRYQKISGDVDIFLRSFEQGPVVLYRLSSEPRQFQYVSENIRVWGYTADEMQEAEMDLSKLIFSEDRPRVLEELRSRQPKEISQLCYRVITKSGNIRWVLDYSRIEQDEKTGQIWHTGYLIDVTDHKKYEARLMEDAESANAANVAKSHFLANMSHEIRTPLNGINGFLQVLMQMPADEEQREIFDIMYSSSRSLLKIINDILDFSKIESGKMELMPSDFNPRYLIEDLVKQFDHQIKDRAVQISFDIYPGIPDVLKGDQLRLKQILTNLIQNAVKFTSRGKIEIKAELYTHSETELRILFTVSDDGIGIDPVKQRDIFDNYTQVNGHITSKYGGTGLGLAIVKRLVELMQGFIWVESEPGKGSCFFFIIPFGTFNEMSASIPESRHPEILVGKKIEGRILVVEDKPINQLVTQRQLESWGLTVNVAGNGLEAFQMHQQHPYDLILMDIQMPVMDGITATQKIRDMEVAQGRHTPIVAYTAAALVGDRERFLVAGMDEYLAKPIEMNDLYHIINGFLAKQ